MDPLNEALYERRSERLLHAFGLDLVVHEPIYRETKPLDHWPYTFTPIEREGLKVIGTMWKERSDR